MTDRKLRKYEKWLKKELAKGCGVKKRKLFGKNVPQSSASIAIDYFKKTEKEWIELMRERIEMDFKEKHPEFKDLKFNWEDAKR